MRRFSHPRSGREPHHPTSPQPRRIASTSSAVAPTRLALRSSTRVEPRRPPRTPRPALRSNAAPLLPRAVFPLPKAVPSVGQHRSHLEIRALEPRNTVGERGTGPSWAGTTPKSPENSFGRRGIALVDPRTPGGRHRDPWCPTPGPLPSEPIFRASEPHTTVPEPIVLPPERTKELPLADEGRDHSTSLPRCDISQPLWGPSRSLATTARVRGTKEQRGANRVPAPAGGNEQRHITLAIVSTRVDRGRE